MNQKDRFKIYFTCEQICLAKDLNEYDPEIVEELLNDLLRVLIESDNRIYQNVLNMRTEKDEHAGMHLLNAIGHNENRQRD